MSLQACSNVTLEDVTVLGECGPSSHDSSLELLVLVFVSGAVSLSQVDVAFNVLNLSVVDIYWCISFHYHLCLRLVCSVLISDSITVYCFLTLWYTCI